MAYETPRVWQCKFEAKVAFKVIKSQQTSAELAQEFSAQLTPVFSSCELVSFRPCAGKVFSSIEGFCVQSFPG